ncbi:MAG: hypothetical protein IKZ91_04170 [Bacteroidales bacterium]|nr:hypothetical protein [Bacteroidales bacterium]
MKNVLKILLLAAVLAFIPAIASAQKKIYTKSYRIQDFKSRTTMIVLGSNSKLDPSLREEVTALWTISPYEFCTPAQYDKLKSDPARYFLRPVTAKGIISLVLTKGGTDNSANVLETPMTLATIPIAGEESLGTIAYLPAFLSILQDYVERALDSERIAYSGISAVKTRRHPEDKAITVLVSSDGTAASRPRYRYVIDPGTYQLYSFRKW